MPKEFTINDSQVLPIGLGTYGYGEPDLQALGISNEHQIESIRYAFSKGVNYVVGYPAYANGLAAKLLAEAIKSNAHDLYVTFCAYPQEFTEIAQAEAEFDNFLKSLSVDHIDTFMVSSQYEGRFGRAATQAFMHKIFESGRAKSLGVNNFNLEQLNAYYEVFGKKIVVHELCHNFEIRIYEDLGILARTRELGIQPVVYQPIRRNRTALRNWPLLVELAEKYQKTQNQIIFNWLTSIGLLCLTKAGKHEHIDENLASLDFEMSTEDRERINAFRPKWEIPKINWTDFNSTDGVYIAKLSNVFEEWK